MDKTLKQKYKEDFAALTTLVNSFDPCGLIGSGAPPDEYDCLTHKLLSAVYNKKTLQELKDLVLHELTHHFAVLPDTATLEEPVKSRFYNNLNNLLAALENKFY